MTATSALKARPPRSWELQTTALLAVIWAIAVLGIVTVATILALRTYLVSDGVSGMSSLVSMMVDNGTGVDFLYLLLVFCYIAGFAKWRMNTRKMLLIVGDQTGAAARHWTVHAWTLSLFTAFALGLSLPPIGTTPEEAAAALGWYALQAGLRLVAQVFLLFGVWQIREQVRTAVAESGVALRIDAPARRSAIPARPLPPAPPLPPAAAIPQADELPPADDEFWNRAARQASDMRAEVAVLVSTGQLGRRWALIPASGDVTAVRATVPAGAVITVFPDPPAATETADFTPPPADGYVGLLEDAATGALSFQSVAAAAIPIFLTRARSAHRWALYPGDSLVAQSATMPPANTTVLAAVGEPAAPAKPAS